MRERLRRVLPISSIVLFGAILRLWHITASSIWHDEGYTMLLIHRGPLEIIRETVLDVHPPLYYLLLRGWTELFGSSELAVRGMSALFGILTIPLVYGIGRRLFGERVGLLAALFTALSGFLIRFSGEARMYSLLACLTSLATYLFVRALQERGSRWWVLYSLSLVLAIYTQYYGILVAGAHGVYLAGLSARDRRIDWGVAGRFALAVAAALALFAPWLPVMLAQARRVRAEYWIKPEWISAHTIPDSLYQFVVFDHLDRWLHGIWHLLPALMLASVVGVGAYRYRERRSRLLLAASLLLVPTSSIWIYSKAVTPVYLDRYFPMAAVGFYLLLAALIASLGRGWLRAVSVVALAGCLIVGIGVAYGSENHRMREAATVVNSHFQPGDAIISLDLYTYFDFHYYNRTGEEPILYYHKPLDHGEPALLRSRPELRVKELARIHPASGRVWTVGKTGKRSYYHDVPAGWRLVSAEERGTIEIREYRVAG